MGCRNGLDLGWNNLVSLGIYVLLFLFVIFFVYVGFLFLVLGDNNNYVVFGVKMSIVGWK